MISDTIYKWEDKTGQALQVRKYKRPLFLITEDKCDNKKIISN